MPPMLQPLRVLRRAALVLGGAFSVLIVIGIVLIASRDLDALSRDVIEAIKGEPGARLMMGGLRANYWPRPRVIINDLDFELPGGLGTIKAPRAILTFGLLDMMDGQVDAPQITLENPAITLDIGTSSALYQSPRALLDVLDRLSGMFEGHERIAALRVVIENGHLVASQRGNRAQDLAITPLDLTFKYNAKRGRIEVVAQRRSDPHPLSLMLSLPTRAKLALAKTAPISIDMSGYGSRAALNGILERTPSLSLSANISASIQEALERELGLRLHDKRNNTESLTQVSAFLSLDPRGGGLEALRISRGNGGLTGIAALRENNGRWTVSATLAGDLIDGTATHAALQRLKTGDGHWSEQAMDINPAPRLDLDIRLSTKTFRLGRLTLENAALAVFTRAGRAEFSVADAQYGGGHVKARVAIMEREGGQDMRLLLAGDNIEAANLLDEAFGLNRLQGTGNFVFQLESRGQSTRALVDHLSGTGSIDIKNGSIIGLDVNRLMNRSADLRPEAALFAALGGNTPFAVLGANLSIHNGKIEPVGYRFETPRVEAQLDGEIDLAAQRHALALVLKRRQDQPGLAREFFGFRIEGPLLAPTIKTDQSLLQR